MSQIGISFVFRASTAAFTRGVASANNALKDLKKSVRDLDIGMGLKGLLGVGGIVSVFRSAITNAQQLREEMERLGKPLDPSIRSVAEFGDGLTRLVGVARNAATSILSIYTGVGDGLRQIFQGVTAEQEEQARRQVEITEKAAREQEAKLKAAREANSPEKQAEAQAALDRAEGRASNRATGPERKMVDLINERATLEEELKGVGAATVEAKKIRTKIAENQRALDEASAESDEAAAREAERKKQAEEGVKRQRLNKVALTVEDLAAQETGGFTDANDPRLRARRALEMENRARMLGERGDIAGALELQGKADAVRKSLEGVTATSQVLTPDTAKTAFQEALTKTNEELAAVKEALGGIIKAQK